MNPYFFIFGFGYTAKALADKLVAHGFNVIGTSRTPEYHEKSALHIKLIDFNSPDIDKYLSLATHILICIPPANTLSESLFAKYGDLIKKQASLLKWIGYLSSTGVYGNHDGNWVNENSICTPHTKTGISRLQDEQVRLSFAKKYHLPLHIFRLSGIYGPGRNALERILDGKKQSIFKENQVFCRVHVEDILSTLLASIKLPNPLSIYNISDDEPAPTHEVDQYACTLLHKEPLVLVSYTKANLSPMEKEFYANNRRVSNLKIKEELGVVLKYPTYKEGLNAIRRTYV